MLVLKMWRKDTHKFLIIKMFFAAKPVNSENYSISEP